MIEGGEEFRLALKPRGSIRVLRKSFRQYLQGDLALQARIACAIDLAMPPAPSVPVISYEPM